MNRKNYTLIILVFFAGYCALFGQNPNLIPQPQQVKWGKAKFYLSGARVLIPADIYKREQKPISRFLSEIKQLTGTDLKTAFRGQSGSKLIVLNSEQQGAPVPLPGEIQGENSREAYKISVSGGKVQVSAKTDAGLFYALQTLLQLIVNDGNRSYLPEVEINDYPTFAYRGVMMDFAHGALLTEDEIKKQIDFLARWKTNQYYFYNEANIEIKGYPLINYQAHYTQEQITRIINYGRERHIDVIPFVNFYGHLHDLLRFEKYESLGVGNYGHDLDPDNPQVQVLIGDWIKQYQKLFPSPFIHIGFDETWESERLKKEFPLIKPKDLYLKQLNFVAQTLQSIGKTVMLWTDITHNYPDIMSQFPKEVIPVVWEYSCDSAAIPQWITPIKKAKMPFLVQSAVDNWGNVYPSASASFDNMDNCLRACRREKALGHIVSVWTDAVQPLLRNTWLFMAYGMAGSWQNGSIDNSTFTAQYCKIMYPEMADLMSIGFTKMAESETLLAACTEQHTIKKLWENPFTDVNLKNTASHLSDYKQARYAAELALESLLEALRLKTSDSVFIKTMLVNCKMLHYDASRYIWAKTIVDRVEWMNKYEKQGEGLGNLYYDINYPTHGLLVDMMDWITGLKAEYCEAWLSENMPYRMGTISGRFDSEYLQWRNLSMKLDYYANNGISIADFKFGDAFLNIR